MNNWDNHYKSKWRVWLTRLGLKGNLVLNRHIAKHISNECIHTNSYIEIGAGSGVLAALLKKKFKKIVLLDKSPAALSLASRIADTAETKIADIFEFNTNEKFDAVVSIGLAEHFSIEQMHHLVQIHIDLLAPQGKAFICVPSYSPLREQLIRTPAMIKKYGYQDAKAQYIIEEYLTNKRYAFTTMYLDHIPDHPSLFKWIKRINILTIKVGMNLEIFFNKKRGDYYMFIIEQQKNKLDD